MAPLGWLTAVGVLGYLGHVRLFPTRQCRGCGGDGKVYSGRWRRTWRTWGRCRGRGGRPRWAAALVGEPPR
jgi:hypothetical protein